MPWGLLGSAWLTALLGWRAGWAAARPSAGTMAAYRVAFSLAGGGIEVFGGGVVTTPVLLVAQVAPRWQARPLVASPTAAGTTGDGRTSQSGFGQPAGIGPLLRLRNRLAHWLPASFEHRLAAAGGLRR